MGNENKNYLGDGVYANFDGFHIVLTTLEGMIIFLDPEVTDALMAYSLRMFPPEKT